MITVIVPTLNSQAHLTRCFDSLIPAAVQGVVREVIVADGGSTDDTLFIADAAGAHVVRAGKERSSQLSAGAAAARNDWLLFLHPECALESGWEHDAENFMSRTALETPQAAVFRFGVNDFGIAARWRAFGAALRFMAFALPYGDQGLLISRRLYQKIGGYRALTALEDVDIVRRIGRRRLGLLRTRAITAKIRATRPRFGKAFLSALKVPTHVLARIYR